MKIIITRNEGMDEMNNLRFGLVAALALMLAGCSAEKSAEPAVNQTRTVHYLDQAYTVPAKTDRIVVTGSLEAMEDALVLDVKPTGAITVGGKFPDMFKKITGDAQSVGEKAQPNLETILKLKPDVILGSTKFPPDVSRKLAKIAPVIPISHIGTNWEENLNLLAELTGKQGLAKQVLKQYKDDVAVAKKQLGDRLHGKKVVVVRIRGGNIMIYPENVFFNPTLYQDLGLAVPQEIKNAKAQEVISLEKFSEMNPDYIFVQFSEDENKDHPKSLETVVNNPIWQSTRAAQNNHVYVNVVDPLAQGGTAWSKIHFLQAAVEKLSNE